MSQGVAQVWAVCSTRGRRTRTWPGGQRAAGHDRRAPAVAGGGASAARRRQPPRAFLACIDKWPSVLYDVRRMVVAATNRLNEVRRSDALYRMDGQLNKALGSSLFAARLIAVHFIGRQHLKSLLGHCLRLTARPIKMSHTIDTKGVALGSFMTVTSSSVVLDPATILS